MRYTLRIAAHAQTRELLREAVEVALDEAEAAAIREPRKDHSSAWKGDEVEAEWSLYDRS